MLTIGLPGNSLTIFFFFSQYCFVAADITIPFGPGENEIPLPKNTPICTEETALEWMGNRGQSGGLRPISQLNHHTSLHPQTGEKAVSTHLLVVDMSQGRKSSNVSGVCYGLNCDSPNAYVEALIPK